MTNEKEGPAVHGGGNVGRAQGRDVGGVNGQGALRDKAGICYVCNEMMQWTPLLET